MKVRLIPFGPAVNESEKHALDYVTRQLESASGEDEWMLLTNVMFSVSHVLQSDEIDLVAIGPPGVRIIEVKHWNPQWVKDNGQTVKAEADRVSMTARRVGTTLRRRVSGLPEVDAVILVTWKASEWRAGNPPRAVRGVPLVPLDGWQEALGLGDPAVLSREEMCLLCRDLEPRTACGQLGREPIRFAGLVNLRLQTSPEERFHRMYLGIRARQRDQVVLHLYDLSASSERNPHGVAQREFEVLHRL